MENKIVDYKTAKIAKHKGFWLQDILDCYFYTVHSPYPRKYEYGRVEPDENTILAPTQSLLQKWLREKFNIIVTAFTDFVTWQVEIIHPDLENPFYFDFDDNGDYMNSYEDALELGLQKGLEIIHLIRNEIS